MGEPAIVSLHAAAPDAEPHTDASLTILGMHAFAPPNIENLLADLVASDVLWHSRLEHQEDVPSPNLLADCVASDDLCHLRLECRTFLRSPPRPIHHPLHVQVVPLN